MIASPTKASIPLYFAQGDKHTLIYTRSSRTYLLLHPLGGVQVSLDELEGTECLCFQQ